MTVEQLIDELKKIDPKAVVYCLCVDGYEQFIDGVDEETEYGYANVEKYCCLFGKRIES